MKKGLLSLWIVTALFAQAKDKRPKITTEKLISKSSTPVTVIPRIRPGYNPRPMLDVRETVDEWCGTMPAWIEKYGTPRACTYFGATDDPTVRDSFIPTAATDTLIIRLYVHAFADDSGNNPTAELSDAEAQLLTLNEAYSDYTIKFDMTFQIHNDAQYQEISSAEWSSGEIKEAYAADPLQYHNLYVTNSSSDWGILGVSTFPWDSEALTKYGGTIVDKDWFGGPRTFWGTPNISQHTITHELGHALGLWHTHHGVYEVTTCGDCYEGADGYTYDVGDSADVVGDLCSDTKATTKNFSCADPDTFDCQNNDFIDTDFHNFMGYADDDCYDLDNDGFSTQQSGRMHGWITDKYLGLIADSVNKTLLSTSFEDGMPNDWSVIDNDGDGNVWYASYNPYYGDVGVIVRWNSGGNDDWLITPEIQIPSTFSSASFSFWARSIPYGTTREDFNVMLATAGTAVSNFTTTLGAVTDASDSWTQYSYDLSSYAGQSIYLAVQCVSINQYYLNVDDFLVSGDRITNYAPVASDTSFTTDEDVAVGITLSATDADGDSLTYAVVDSPAYGTISGSGSGSSYSLSFDGVDDYVRISDNTNLESLTDGNFSFSVWASPIGTPNTDGQIVARPGWHMGIVYSLNKHFIAEIWDENNDQYTVSTLETYEDSWHHLVMTYDSITRSMHLYVDGDSIGTVIMEADIRNYNTDYFLGMANTTPSSQWSYPFSGRIDDLAFYDIVLSGEEIAALYNSGFGLDASTNSGNYTSSANIQGYWRFDQNSGTTLYDLSENGNNGNIYGATWSNDSPVASLIYTPNANYNGSDSFTFTASDGEATSNTATVSLTINAVDDPPSAFSLLSPMDSSLLIFSETNAMSDSVMFSWETSMDPDDSVMYAFHAHHTIYADGDSAGYLEHDTLMSGTMLYVLYEDILGDITDFMGDSSEIRWDVAAIGGMDTVLSLNGHLHFNVDAHEAVDYGPVVIHVDTAGSDVTGDGSIEYPFSTIQAGIDAANDDDTVLVAAGTYVENVNINNNIILTSTSGPENTIIDGNDVQQVVQFGSSTTRDCFLEGFTITNGGNFSGNTDEGGGGIIVEGGSPTLNNLIIKGNTREYWSGGGIRIEEGGNPLIEGCIIKENYASDDGGGIDAWRASFELKNSTISNNASTFGQAISISTNDAVNFKPIIKINNVEINNYNDANLSHLLIFRSCSLRVDNLTLQDISVNGNSIELQNSKGILSGLTVERDTSQNAIVKIYEGSEIDFNNLKISQGKSNDAPGIRIDDNSVVTIDTLLIEDSHWVGGSNAVSIWVNESNFTLDNGKFSNIHAEGSGSALRADDGSRVEISNTFIDSSYSEDYGGGMLFTQSDYISIKNSSFIANRSVNGGGGIHVNEVDSLFLYNSTFIADSSQGGGAVELGGGKYYHLDGNVMENNYSADGAGAINLWGNDKVEIFNSKFISNKSVTDGGAIYSWNTDSLFIKNSTFDGNESTDGNGGAMTFKGDENSTLYCEIRNTTFENNSGGYGGAIAAFEPIDMNIDSVFATGNQASGNGGFIELCCGASVLITNSTIYNNETNNNDLSVDGESNLSIKNSIIWQDIIGGNANGTIEVTYSDVEGGFTGIGNINSNPLFCNPDSSDFNLAENSPCIGTGENGANMGAFGIGCSAILAVEEEFIPTEFALHQNYPNPFNPVTTIQYDIPEAGEMRLDVYNILGERVATLAQGNHHVGRYTIRWDAAGMSSGMYFYRISSAKFTATKKLVLMK